MKREGSPPGRPEGPWPSTSLLIRTGGLVVLLCSAVAVAVPAGLHWDFANFYDAGHKALVGQLDDLYRTGVPIAGQPPLGTLTFLGFPLSAHFYAPLAWFEPRIALPLFKLQNLLAMAATFCLLYAHLRPFAGGGSRGRSRLVLLLIAVALLFQPLWTIFRVGGQTTPTVLLLFTVGLLAHAGGRAWISVGSLALAVLIKPVTAIAALFLFVVSGGAYRARLLVAAGLAAGLSVALAGWHVHELFLRQLLIEGGGTESWTYNSSLTVWADNLRGAGLVTGEAGDVLSAVALVVRLTSVVVLGAIVRRLHREDVAPSARRHAHFLLATVSVLLLSPVVWEHYLSLLLPLLAYLLVRRRHLSTGTRRALWGVLALLPFQNLVFTLWLADRWSPESSVALLAAGAWKGAPLILCVIVLWRGREGLVATYRDWTVDEPADGWPSVRLASPRRLPY